VWCLLPFDGASPSHSPQSEVFARKTVFRNSELTSARRRFACRSLTVLESGETLLVSGKQWLGLPSPNAQPLGSNRGTSNAGPDNAWEEVSSMRGM
jgi:hypothetical protein